MFHDVCSWFFPENRGLLLAPLLGCEAQDQLSHYRHHHERPTSAFR